MQIYSEPLQKFRLAGQGLYNGPQPRTAADRERIAKYFDPLPIWYPPLEGQQIAQDDYPLHAITQRPMMMYHSWDSQNAWLRQILSTNHLYMNCRTAAKLALADEDWVWVESHHGRVRCRLRTMEGVEANTVWTWNAIGRQRGAWGLANDAPEATSGFLLNHLISELLPKAGDDPRRRANADPVTGQAAWFDLRVRVRKAAPDEIGVWPVFDPLPPLPGEAMPPTQLRWNAQ
jgi:anaerobic selenocysteine-containing dehydrogenase